MAEFRETQARAIRRGLLNFKIPERKNDKKTVWKKRGVGVAGRVEGCRSTPLRGVELPPIKGGRAAPLPQYNFSRGVERPPSL